MTGAGPAATQLLVVLGPTGTGKSEVALEVAERLAGEIVGCDSLQVYRGLDAATAKPDLEARRRVPHHLIDCIDPVPVGPKRRGFGERRGQDQRWYIESPYLDHKGLDINPTLGIKGRKLNRVATDLLRRWGPADGAKFGID